MFFTADTHFDHALVAGLRGFDSVAEHDEAVVRQWNATVSENDTVWHLGDVSISGTWKRWAPWVSRLNGRIHLIAGNHDSCHPMHRNSYRYQATYLDEFETVQTMARRRINGTEVLLSHFPYDSDTAGREGDRFTQYRLRDEGVRLIHGHTHGTWQMDYSQNGTPMAHVGWDAWRRPVAQEEVAELFGP